MTERVNQNREGSTAEGPGVASPRAQKIAKIVLYSFVILVFVYYFGDKQRLIQKSHPQPKTPTPAPPQTPAHTTPTAA